MGAIQELILLIGMMFLNYTPRWFVFKGRYDETKKVFNKIKPELNADNGLKTNRIME